MVQTIISDFSRTILFPKDPISFIELNELHKREVARAKDKNVFALNEEDFILTESLYKLEDFFEINSSILQIYSRFKSKGISLILFTNSYIPTHPDIKEQLSVFDKIVNVGELGSITKKDAAAYKLLTQKYNIIPEESIFIDDDENCLKAAASNGIKTIQFPHIKAFTSAQLFEELSKADTNIELEINKLM